MGFKWQLCKNLNTKKTHFWFQNHHACNTGNHSYIIIFKDVNDHTKHTKNLHITIFTYHRSTIAAVALIHLSLASDRHAISLTTLSSSSSMWISLSSIFLDCFPGMNTKKYCIFLQLLVGYNLFFMIYIYFSHTMYKTLFDYPGSERFIE